jgi:hypothetical protein
MSRARRPLRLNSPPKAATSTPGPLSVWLAARRRRILVLGCATCVLAAAGYGAWRTARPRIANSPRHRIAVDAIRITPPPAWIRRPNLVAEVLRDGGLDQGIDALAEDAAERIARAFELHPWVARVVRVRKLALARVSVELEYRRPVCMIEVRDEKSAPGLFPVDREGVLLPTDDFTPTEAAAYPRLSNIETQPIGAVGSSWGDARVRDAAEIAAALFDVWNALGLERIEPQGTGLGPGQNFDLVSRRGLRIHWGPAPGAAPPSEPPASRKLELIQAHATRYGGLAPAPQSTEGLDLRLPAETARSSNPSAAARE